MAKSFLMAMIFTWASANSLIAQDARSTEAAKPRIRTEEASTDTSAPIKVATVEFVSDVPLPSAAEARLRRYMTRRAIYETSDWLEELEGLVKDAWQQYGYFLPEVQTSVRKLGQYSFEHNFALTFRVTAGRQYLLGDFRIKGAKLFSAELLRTCFDLHEGDIFDTHKISAGIDSLRSGYDHQGYIDISVLPSTQIDDNQGRISLLLEVEEGQQFRFGQITVLGLRHDLTEKLLQDSAVKTGAVFSSKGIEDFFRKNGSVLPSGVNSEADVERRINEKTATVDLVFHFNRDE